MQAESSAPPAPGLLRGLAGALRQVGFEAAEQVSAEPRRWTSAPRELMRSALIGPSPRVISGSCLAARDLSRLGRRSPAAAALFELLTVGRPVADRRMCDVPETLRGQLVAAGIAAAAQGTWRARLRVVPLEGLFLLTDFPRMRATLRQHYVQLGLDSALLARMIAAEAAGGARALDLCTGGGVQALALARAYGHVDGVDVNPRALAFAEANAALNGLDARTRFVNGDLFSAASGCYDVITANPPFVFMPDDQAGSNLTGFGGRLGIEITLRILEGLDTHLAERGAAFIYTQAPFIAGRCALMSETASRLAGHALDVEFEEFLRGYWSPARGFYRAQGVRWITCYRIRVTRATRGRVSLKALTGWRRRAVAATVALERWAS